MKSSRNGVLGLALFFSCWVAAGRAQQPPPTTPPPEQTQPPAASPAGQTQPPAPETAPAEPQTPTGLRPAPPPIPKIPDIRQPGETGFFIGAIGWFPVGKPIFDKGKASGFTDNSRLQMQGRSKLAVGGDVGVALGLHNSLRISVFQVQAQGNIENSPAVRVWNQAYAAGTYVSTNYKLQNLKISFDYLTWPYPVESRRFRLKTLWQLQYTSIRTIFDAPKLPLTDSEGNALIDSNGNLISYAAQGTRWFFLPELGLGASEYVSRHLRLEANAAGFAVPHHTTVWDGDASANVRFGHWELRLGGKAFHFKTSTKGEYFLRGTLGSAFVGLRWYSD